jgi:hypothetical protein
MSWLSDIVGKPQIRLTNPCTEDGNGDYSAMASDEMYQRWSLWRRSFLMALHSCHREFEFSVN